MAADATLFQTSIFRPKNRLLENLQYTVYENYRKISLNIASEASYIYILSGQTLIKMPKIGQFGEFLKNWSLQSNSVTRQVNFDRTKISENVKIRKLNATFLMIFKQCEHGRSNSMFEPYLTEDFEFILNAQNWIYGQKLDF